MNLLHKQIGSRDHSIWGSQITFKEKWYTSSYNFTSFNVDNQNFLTNKWPYYSHNPKSTISGKTYAAPMKAKGDGLKVLRKTQATTWQCSFQELNNISSSIFW